MRWRGCREARRLRVPSKGGLAGCAAQPHSFTAEQQALDCAAQLHSRKQEFWTVLHSFTVGNRSFGLCCTASQSKTGVLDCAAQLHSLTAEKRVLDCAAQLHSRKQEFWTVLHSFTASQPELGFGLCCTASQPHSWRYSEAFPEIREQRSHSCVERDAVSIVRREAERIGKWSRRFCRVE